MRNIRIIAKLEVKPPYLVKGIQFEGLRQLGDPNVYALKYYNDGIDEIIYDDIVASLYERNSLEDIIEETSKNIFVPITVSGGIRSIQDVKKILRSGADKVAINTAAIKNENIINDISNKFGSSTIVLSVHAKRVGSKWEAYYDNGRERSYLDVFEWIKKAQDLGVGEILLTSIDNDGTQNGYDINLINMAMKKVNVPIIASGGMGNLTHIENLIKETSVDAISISHCLHYNKFSVSEVREFCLSKNFPVRKVTSK